MDTVKEFFVINKICLCISHKLQLLVPSLLVGEPVLSPSTSLRMNSVAGDRVRRTHLAHFSNAPHKPSWIQNAIRVKRLFESFHERQRSTNVSPHINTFFER